MGVTMEKRLKTFETNWFENLVSISLMLVFSLVTITGILSFVRLNDIIQTVNETISPNRPVGLIKEIYNDLIISENIVKSYNLTRNEADLNRYNEMIIQTGEKVKKLKELAITDKTIEPYTDTLEVLVEKRFDALDMLVIINDDFPVKEAIQEFMMDIYGEMHPENLADSEEFKDLDEMARKINRATKDALTAEQTRSKLEVEWTLQDKMIMDRLRRLITNVELQAARYIREHTEVAEKKAAEVRSIIVIFGLAAALLLVLVGIVIYFYIRRNKEYRLILKKARTDAEELAQARQQFLANMSHEIKTPMNIISGYLDQILKNPRGPELPEQLEIVSKSSNHLLELLNNLLDLSRLQAKKLELVKTDFSPAEIIHDMYRWYKPSAEKKNLILKVEIDPLLPGTVSGDPVRIRQILFNLISNAIKYTDTGTVTVRVFPMQAEDKNPRIVFDVSDTGIGISKDDLDRIFTEFTQGAIGLRKSEGSGLGLYITSKIIEIMEGILTVNSLPDKGSTFKVEIPFDPPSGTNNRENIGELPGFHRLKGLRILVVDDEKYNRSLLKLILGKYGCEITECESGEEATIIAREKDVDIILMDLRLPGISGPDATRNIQRILSERGKDVPVILISTAITTEDLDKLRQTGRVDWIAKPFEEEKLLTAILGLVYGHDQSHPALPDQENNTTGSNDKNQEAIDSSFNLDALRKSCDGNIDYFKEMVYLFLQNTGAGLKEISENTEDGNWVQASAIAHRISAPCKHLRADRLYFLLKEAENQFQKSPGNIDTASLVQEAFLEFESIKTGILSQPEFKTR